MLVAVSVLAAVATEWLCLKFMKRPVNFAFDGSAVVTGILLAYNVPPGVPWWIPVLGSAFAIAVAKQAFGGLGHNIVNPALLGRAFRWQAFPFSDRRVDRLPWNGRTASGSMFRHPALQPPNSAASESWTPLPAPLH